MRSMIPPFAPHTAFCPIRVVIPSVNSKQPVRQQAKSQGMGPKGISWVKCQGLARRDSRASYPGWSPETADFAILAFVDPVWFITTLRPMEILERQVHVSLSQTPSKLHREWWIRSHSRHGDIRLGIPSILAHFWYPK